MILRSLILAALLVTSSAPGYRPVVAHATTENVEIGAPKLHRKIGKIIRRFKRRFPASAIIQVAVRDLNDGQILSTYGDDLPANLASVTKMVTAGAALEILGNQHHFITRVMGIHMTPAHLEEVFLVSSGDPMLKEKDITALASFLRAKGIKKIDRVSVILAPSGPAQFPPGFTQKNTQSGYRAPVGSLNLNRNRYQVRVRPGARVGAPPKVRFSPAANAIKIINTAKTVAGSKDRLHIALKWEGDGLPTLYVSGSIGVRKRSGIGIARLNEHPERWAAENFRTRLSRAGIRVPNETHFIASVPEQATELTTHKSPPLTKIVQHMLKFSDNQVAEALLLAMSNTEDASFASGVARVQSWLEQLGCSTQKIFTHNGSGLYNGGFGSALSVTRMLNLIHERDDLRTGFQSSLASPGRDGTLRRRMRSLPSGIVWAKTGTLNEVSTLCGYVMNEKRPMSFCVLVNGISPKWTGRARNMADAIVKTLVENPKPSRRSARHGR